MARYPQSRIYPILLLGFLGALIMVALIDKKHDRKENCKCRYNIGHPHHTNEGQYTVTNNKCILNNDGTVNIGDKTYTNVHWYSNECN